MPKRKIGADAFAYYMSLGPSGSYEAVAQKYGVSKRAVVKLARKERWQEKLEEIQKKARQGATEKALESLSAMNDRHLKSLRFLQSKAIEALRSMPLDTAIAAARALDLAIRNERIIRGDAGDGGSVEQLIKSEYERWMTTEEADDELNERLSTAEESGEASDPIRQEEVLR